MITRDRRRFREASQLGFIIKHCYPILSAPSGNPEIVTPITISTDFFYRLISIPSRFFFFHNKLFFLFICSIVSFNYGFRAPTSLRTLSLAAFVLYYG